MSEEVKNGWYNEGHVDHVKNGGLGPVLMCITWWVFYQNDDVLEERIPRKEYPLNKSDREKVFRDNNNNLNYGQPG